VVVTEEFVPDAPHLVVGGHVLVICCGRSGFGYCSGWWSGASWKATPDVGSFLGDEPAMLWGSSIVGFGSYDYRYESGHEGTSALAGFAPRKPHLVIYLVGGFRGQARQADGRPRPTQDRQGVPLRQAAC
jgi:hypothetical protein